MLKKKVVGQLMGGTWELEVFYRKSPKDFAQPCFEMVKQYDMNLDRARYAARPSNGGAWQEFDNLNELVLVMTTKHRIMGG